MAPITTNQAKMGKVKASKGAGKIPNKAMHSRVSYLFQAATYLATQHSKAPEALVESSTNRGSDAQAYGAMGMAKAEMRAPSDSKALLQPASRRFISDLRAVSLKAQMRMSPGMKHTVCKNCDTLLVDGSTCTSQVENKSKEGKKPWADVLLRKCNTCGMVRRFPVAAERQKRRPQRSTQDPENIEE